MSTSVKSRAAWVYCELNLVARYLICQGMRLDSAPVRDYMFTLNEWFQQHWGVLVEEDLREIVPLKKLKQDEQFYQYIFDSNEKYVVFGASPVISGTSCPFTLHLKVNVALCSLLTGWAPNKPLH